MTRAPKRIRKVLPLFTVLLFASPAIAGIVLGGGERPSYDDRADVSVGRIVAVDPRDQYVIVDFPFGQWILSASGVDVGRYQSLLGRELAFDHDLRPLWSAEVPRTGAVSPGG